MREKLSLNIFSTHEKGCTSVQIDPVHLRKTTIFSRQLSSEIRLGNFIFDNYSEGSIALIEVKTFLEIKRFGKPNLVNMVLSHN